MKDSRPSTAFPRTDAPPALDPRPLPSNPVHEPPTATATPGVDVTAVPPTATATPGVDVTAAPAIATATPGVDVTALPNPGPLRAESTPVSGMADTGALRVGTDVDAGGLVAGAASSSGAQAATAQALEQLARAGLHIHLHHHRAADPTVA